MHPDLVAPQMSQIPPWKLELLSRRSALSRTVEPKLNEVLLDPLQKQSQSDPSSSSLEHNITTKVSNQSKSFTTWKELKDGAAIVNGHSVNNFQRPLSTESRTTKTHPQVVTCATLFNGDGAFKSSNVERGRRRGAGGDGEPGDLVAASLDAPPSSSTRSISTGAPLSPGSSLDWSQSTAQTAPAVSQLGWPAHRPSARRSSLDFRTLSAVGARPPLVNPTQPSNRDQANLSFTQPSHQATTTHEITDSNPGNALLAKRILDDPGSSASTDHRPPFVRNSQSHLRPAGKLKMGEDNASNCTAFVEKAPDSSCNGASSDEIGLDSDSSSDEIHYGPGFVSRLKSRYMSAALRSSTTANPGGLRRTASLEDFLDKDKEEVSIELNVHQPKVTVQQGRYQRKDERTSRASGHRFVKINTNSPFYEI